MYLEKIAQDDRGLSQETITALIEQTLEGRDLKKVLILPPDYTRFHSGAGFITCEYRRILQARGCQVDILPALGTHEAVSRPQWERMFPGIPYEEMLVHNWRTDVVRLGEVPADYVTEITGGLWNEAVDCEVNRLVMDESYDLILSPGQVVPHEVIGMANESKNIFVGVGGSDMISKSHMISAVYGIENVMGRDHSPVRRIFDYCLEHFLADRPVLFFLTVTTAPEDEIVTHGVFIGRERRALEHAIALAEQKNINWTDRPFQKCVVNLPEDEFKSTWIGNKSVYRTRMAIADGGELLVLGAGIKHFGEDPEVDVLVRKYGYKGTQRTMDLFYKNRDMQENMSVPAHLMQGSADGRFSITYAVRDVSLEEMEQVGFHAVGYEETKQRYDPAKLHYGWNTMEDGEEIFYIPNPALGLWIYKGKFASI